MCEDIKADYDVSPNQLCYACLCRTRRTVSLGEYGAIYNRIVYFNVEDLQHVKLCWECFAILKKVKKFETKCYISQRILRTKWEENLSQGLQPRCLSTLVQTPVKINVYSDASLNDCEEKLGFTFDDKSIACSLPNKSSNNETNEHDLHNHSNEEEYYIKEEDLSLEDHIDNKSDVDYNDDFNEIKDVDKDHISHKESEEIKQLHSDKYDVFIKISVDQINKIEVNDKLNGISLREDVDNHISNTSSHCKIQNSNTKADRKKGLKKKDLEEYYRSVRIDSSNIKKFRSIIKISPNELEFWREHERNLDYFVDQPYKCISCICGFSSLNEKCEHDKKYHDTSSPAGYICDICDSRFAAKRALRAHVRAHFVRYECALCPLSCASRRALRAHVARHRRYFACARCDAVFANIRFFYKHFRADHAVFICDHCGKRCRTKYTLEKHMKHHTEKNVCTICDRVYASRNSLRNHSEMKHRSAPNETAYCVKCDKQFANTPLYRRHVQTSKAHAAERDADSNKREVNCPMCGNVYSRKTYMMNHYRHVHMKQSKHYCVDCDRHFLNRTRYVEHRRYTHEGETKAKDKMCNFCGKGFATNRILANHIRTHSGERPFACQYCDAKFTQKHAMQSHVKYVHLRSKRRGLQ